MKNIIKNIFSSLLFLLLNFSYGQSLCDLQLVLENDLYKSEELLETIYTKPELIDSWKNLHLASSKFVKTNPTYLQTFNKLSPENQKLIAQFTDVDANSTLVKFLDDINADKDFLDLINDAENNIYAKGLVLHKPSVAENLTADELRQLNDFVEDLDEIPNLNFRNWLNRSENLSNLQKYASEGTAFGKEMITQLKNIDSDAYKTLKTTLSGKGINIEDYSIYSQIQLCIKGDCISKGNYWIPDFALIAKKTNALDKEYFEVIIVDSKLFRSTDWSANQKIADNMQQWTIKSVKNENLIQGSNLNLKPKSLIERNGDFIKIFNDNGILQTANKSRIQ